MNATFEPYLTEISKKPIPCLKVKIRLIRVLYAYTCTQFVFMEYHSGLHSFPALTLLRQKWIGKDTFIITIILVSFFIFK